jgi:hypothetical protein
MTATKHVLSKPTSCHLRTHLAAVEPASVVGAWSEVNPAGLSALPYSVRELSPQDRISHLGEGESIFFHAVRLWPLFSLLYQAQMIDDDDRLWIGRGNQVLGETCPSATLSTTNLTWPDPGSNPGSRGGKPATNQREPNSWRWRTGWMIGPGRKRLGSAWMVYHFPEFWNVVDR